MHANDLALQERPRAFNVLRVDEPAKANILARGVIDREVGVILAETDKRHVFVSQNGGTLGDVPAHLALKRLRLVILDVFGAKLAVAFDHAEHNSLTGAALRAALAVLGVLVLLLAANEGRIGLDLALERRIE